MRHAWLITRRYGNRQKTTVVDRYAIFFSDNLLASDQRQARALQVSIVEATGELTNASAARGKNRKMLTIVVRRPEEEGRPEVPPMTLRSHSRGDRSSACLNVPGFT